MSSPHPLDKVNPHPQVRCWLLDRPPSTYIHIHSQNRTEQNNAWSVHTTQNVAELPSPMGAP